MVKNVQLNKTPERHNSCGYNAVTVIYITHAHVFTIGFKRTKLKKIMSYKIVCKIANDTLA